MVSLFYPGVFDQCKNFKIHVCCIHPYFIHYNFFLFIFEDRNILLVCYFVFLWYCTSSINRFSWLSLSYFLSFFNNWNYLHWCKHKKEHLFKLCNLIHFSYVHTSEAITKSGLRTSPSHPEIISYTTHIPNTTATHMPKHQPQHTCQKNQNKETEI